MYIYILYMYIFSSLMKFDSKLMRKGVNRRP